MEVFESILKLCAGVGLFLFAMYLLEESLKNLSGRNFKIFLQRISKNSIGGVVGGAVVTAVLQSSSMVSLMVLAFVGAGVFTMKNAMAIILGANLGTTLDSWVVATIGFKLNLELIAYPAVFIGGFLLIIYGKRNTIKYLAYFLLGFGLLFIGLAFMKTAMEVQVKEFNFSQYAAMSLSVFLLIGFIITLLVQSSSVTMALTLSALHAGAIGFAPAVAIVLGAETGTTIKIVLSALGGNASKKRVVLGNFLFNIFLTVLAFIFLKPILYLIVDLMNISNPLIGLVTFSTLINLVSIVIFLPLLNPFAKFLELFFKDTDASAAAFIGHADVEEPETALDLFRKETNYFIHNSMLFILRQFESDTKAMQEQSNFKLINEKRKFNAKTPEEQYEFLKQLQGELHVAYLALRIKLNDENSARLNQLISAARSSMYAVKSINDIVKNITNLSSSSKDIKFNFFLLHKKETENLYNEFNTLIMQNEKAEFEKLQQLYDAIENNYSSALNSFYKDAQHAAIDDLDITTAINFNRELFTSDKAMLMAVKDFLLDEKLAKDFNDVPSYKT